METLHNLFLSLCCLVLFFLTQEWISFWFYHMTYWDQHLQTEKVQKVKMVIVVYNLVKVHPKLYQAKFILIIV